MKKAFVLLTALALTAPILADPASHRKAAEELVSLVAGEDIIKTAFNGALEPMYQGMRQRGAPAGMIADFHAAIDDWFKIEIKWDELKPQMAELYAQEYSESDLNAILAFVHTPAGIKMIKSTPILMQKGMALGQQYAMSKQASHQKRLQEITARYQPAPPTSPAPNAGVTPPTSTK